MAITFAGFPKDHAAGVRVGRPAWTLVRWIAVGVVIGLVALAYAWVAFMVALGTRLGA